MKAEKTIAEGSTSGDPPVDAPNAPAPEGGGIGRRQALKAMAGLGIGSAVFQRAVAARAGENGEVTVEMIRQAEWIAGLELSKEDREATAQAVERAQRNVSELRAVEVDYDVPPAMAFHAAPLEPVAVDQRRGRVEMIEREAPQRPAAEEDLAFLPVTELAALVRTRQVSSVELVRLYLARLRRHDPVLHCVVSYTEDLAMRQAEKADREIAAGRYRGPLHGIPWGAKDLIAYPGYKTTWGATPFKDRVLDVKATVAERLENAGAVLVAKLTLGALAQGDQWFGGKTRNPWNPEEGSSGSSAGSASATAAGLVGFALGSETWGSIISPCRRCGATGLRPTFGRISRYGCMSLAWSMDKLGPITRAVEDCALILGVLHGADQRDPTAVDRPFRWPLREELRSLKVGYVETDTPAEEREDLRVLRDLGVRLVRIELPKKYPVRPVTIILNTEAATVFDELTRKGITEGLNKWPNAFRQGQFTPAVEYLRANRIRTLLMREMEDVMADVDVYTGGDDSALTNLTGHPSVVLPNGFEERDGAKTPGAITFTGKPFGETKLLAIARAYQDATGHHLEHPPLGESRSA